MKNALPENAKIAKEAKECMQECVSEFISFITSEGTLAHCYRLLAGLKLLMERCSVGKMSPGEAQDSQWRGYFVCHDVARLRELFGGAKDLSGEISRGGFPLFAMIVWHTTIQLVVVG